MKAIPIPVVAGHAAPRRPQRPLAPALLHEIAGHLERFLETGATAVIDLRREPMRPDDRALLDGVLGEGGIDASVADDLGTTRVREAAVSGVWRVTHYNKASEVVAEFIEVTALPEPLRAHRDDVRFGLERLLGQLGNLPTQQSRPTARSGSSIAPTTR